jgi:hypothetical protein
MRVPSALEHLAEDRERFGLRLIPPHPLVTGNTKEDVELDIVAVHGLGGDFCRTWTKKADAHLEHDVFWLSQLLPVDLPGARVYSFGYDSQPAFSKSVATIRAFSQQLLQHLLAHSQAVSFPWYGMDDRLIVPRGQASPNNIHLPQPWRSRR